MGIAEPILLSTLECPHCGVHKQEAMPTDACWFYYECTGCARILKPLAGDCCVFCSYGDVQCPPMQGQGGCCAPSAVGTKDSIASSSPCPGDETIDSPVATPPRVTIEILANPGCSKCAAAQGELHAVAAAVLGEGNLIWREVNVRDELDYVVALGVMSMPAIAVNGELRFSSLPTAAQFRAELARSLPG